jgi:hypothetical protein
MTLMRRPHQLGWDGLATVQQKEIPVDTHSDQLVLAWLVVAVVAVDSRHAVRARWRTVVLAVPIRAC